MQAEKSHLTHFSSAICSLSISISISPIFAVVPVPVPAAVIIELRCPRCATPTLYERRLQTRKIKGRWGSGGGKCENSFVLDVVRREIRCH